MNLLQTGDVRISLQLDRRKSNRFGKTAAAESAYRQYRVVQWLLLPEGELCLRPAANAGLPIQWTGTIWPDCYIYGCASAEQINLFCTRLLRNLADAIYTVAPRQLQTSLHCSRLLRIFAAGIEVWCNGSTTDFGSVCPGSNPGTSTEKVRPFDRTFLIHSSFLNVYVSRGLQSPCNVEPVASRRPQALTFRHQPRRSRPAGSIGRRGGSYCRRTSSAAAGKATLSPARDAYGRRRPVRGRLRKLSLLEIMK